LLLRVDAGKTNQLVKMHAAMPASRSTARS
jgi:hypothetical protein